MISRAHISKLLSCVLSLVPVAAIAAQQTQVPLTIGDTDGSNQQGWKMAVDGTCVLTSAPGANASTSVWLTNGTKHKITIWCSTTADVTKFDYHAYVGATNPGALVQSPLWRVDDGCNLLGNHFIEGDNSFNPSNYVAYVTICTTTNGPDQIVKEPSSGEPIGLLNGNLFFNATDVAIPCPGIPLTFARDYDSRRTSKGRLGSGWIDNYDWTLTRMDYVTGSATNAATNAWVILTTGEAQEYSFRRLTNGTYAPSFDNNWKLNSFTNRYELALPGGMIYSFDTNGVLNTISNLWGNALALSYSNSYPSNFLVSVQHSNGKKLNFTFGTNGLITRVDTPLTNLWISLSYNSLRLLTGATWKTSMGDFTKTYSYATNAVMTQRVNQAGDVFSYRYATNGWGSMQCTNLCLGSNYYQHSVQYDFNTNQYMPTNRTVLTYRTRGTNQVYEYNYDFETLRMKELYGPGTTTGAVSRGVHYRIDSAGNTTNETAYDTTVRESNIVVRLFDSLHNVTNAAVGYCSAPSNWWSSAWDTNYFLPTLETDPDGCKTAIDYTNSYPKTVKLYYSATSSYDTVFAYTTNGLLSAVTNANGHWVQFGYSDLGYVTSTVPQVGPGASYEYNVMGLLTKLRLPSAENDTNDPPNMILRDTVFARDDLGRVTGITYCTGLSETFSYDSLGNLTNHIDTGGRTTRYTYLPSRKLSSAIRGLSTGAELTNSLAYDNQFNTLTITDAKGRAVETYLMDIMDRVTSVTNLELQSMSVTYGIGQYVKKLSRFDSTTVTNTFDGDGRLSVVKYPGSTNTFTYTKAGRPLTVSNEVAAISNSWQQTGWLSSSRTVIKAGPTATVTYAYCPAGNVSNVTSVAGTNFYGYDEVERLSSLATVRPGLAAPLGFQFSYDQYNGLVSAMVCTNNGLTANYTFDNLDRVTGISWSSTNSASRSFAYAYNDAGMIVSVGREDGVQTVYGYDDLDRLTNAVSRNPDGTAISDETFGLDAVGNRTSKVINGIAVSYAYGTNGNRLSSWSVTQTNLGAALYVHGFANEAIGTNTRYGQLWVNGSGLATNKLTPFVDGTNFWAFDMPMNTGTQTVSAAIRDQAGNTTFVTNTVVLSIVTNGAYLLNSAGCVTNVKYSGSAYSRNIGLTWNGLYQLTEAKTNGASVERNGFDALGRRMWNWDGTATNYFVYDGAQVIADLNSTGGIVRSYVWGPGIDNLLAMTVHTGATARTYFAMSDHLGTVHALVDETGRIVESYRFDAWGRVLGIYDAANQPIAESSVGNRYLWQGREYSIKTGFYYFRARWYDPITGRWLSNDPIGISGGLNQYCFCNCNPVNSRDPSGCWVLQAFGALVGGVVNYANNFNGYVSGQISGADYAKSIVFGAGAGLLSTMIPGAGGVVAGGALAGVNDAYNQSINTSNTGIDLKQSGKAAAIGLAVGSMQFVGGKALENIGEMPDQIGKVVGSAESLFQSFSEAGAVSGLAAGTLLSEAAAASDVCPKKK